jgi:hypothetical protein
LGALLLALARGVDALGDPLDERVRLFCAIAS